MASKHTGGQAQAKLTAYVISEYGDICHLCARPGADTKDHLLPLSRGGTDDIENLRPAHRICNGRRGNRLLSNALLNELRGTAADEYKATGLFGNEKQK